MYTFEADQCPSLISSAMSSDSLATDFEESGLEDSVTSLSSLGSFSCHSYYDDDDDNGTSGIELVLPSYDGDQKYRQEPKNPEENYTSEPVHYAIAVPPSPSRSQLSAADDSSVEEEPVQNVDFLFHKWREEDIWTSWRYITTHRSVYNNGARLENASWRTWAKCKLNLKTVSPESLNWLASSFHPTALLVTGQLFS